jgi:hypothetical protein
VSGLPERLPLPGASYLKPRPVHLDELPADRVTAAMATPATMPDGWWVALLWAQDERGVISCREVAPPAGPPPVPPLERIGALMTNGLGDLLAVEAERSCLKLRLVGKAADPAEPWRRPLVLQVAARWDPLRVATMTGTKVAEAALDAFARAIEIARRP